MLVVEFHVNTVVVVGDLFDKPVVSPRLVRKVSGALEGVRCILLSGNHDIRMGVGSAVWYVSSNNSNVMAVDEITEIDGLLLVPYDPTSDCRTRIAETISHAYKASVLIGHFGVYSSDTDLVYMKRDRWFISEVELFDLMDEANLRLCVFGHRHDSICFDDPYRKVIGIGSLSPVKRSETGLSYGNLVLFDKNSVSVHENVVPGIRYTDEECEGMCSVSDDGVACNTEGSIYDLIGKKVCLNKPVTKTEKSVTKVSDPTSTYSVAKAICGFIDATNFVGSEIGLKSEAVSLVENTGVRQVRGMAARLPSEDYRNRLRRP